MLDPSPRQTSLLVRFAIVAVTLLAMVKFLPRATGAERPADDAVFRHTVEPSRETGFAPSGKQSCGGA